jgi:hypothetical protein
VLARANRNVPFRKTQIAASIEQYLYSSSGSSGSCCSKCKVWTPFHTLHEHMDYALRGLACRQLHGASAIAPRFVSVMLRASRKLQEASGLQSQI